MSDVTINYKGNAIATMDASGTKTLLTKGKYCEDDIEVAYGKPGGGGSNIDPDAVLIGTTATEMHLKDLLAAHPIPLKYTSEICLVRYYSPSAPTQGNGVSNWNAFVVENLSPVGLLTNYSNSSPPSYSPNDLGKWSVVGGANGAYFAVNDYKIKNGGLTNSSRYFPAGTQIYALHIPFDWSTFKLTATEL